MADYAQIEVELKGLKYTTEATDSAGILFLSILFNEEETQLIKLGRMQDAVTKYSERAASRMKAKLESAKNPEERQEVEDMLNNEIMMELWQRMERNWEARSSIAERIVELFRFARPHAIPKEQVFYQIYKEGDKQYLEFGINLSAADLLTLFSAIVGPTLASFKKNNPESGNSEAKVSSDKPKEGRKTSEEAIATNESSKDIDSEQYGRVLATGKPVIHRYTDSEAPGSHIDLVEQRSAIVKLLESNLSPNVRTALMEQLQEIDVKISA